MRTKPECTAAQRCLTAAGCKKERNERGGGKMVADTKCGVVFFSLTSHGYFTWRFSERNWHRTTRHNNYSRNFTYISQQAVTVLSIYLLCRETPKMHLQQEGLALHLFDTDKKKKIFDRFSLPRHNHHSNAWWDACPCKPTGDCCSAS